MVRVIRPVSRRRTGSRMKRRSRAMVRRSKWPRGGYTQLRSIARRYGSRLTLARTPFPNSKFVKHVYCDTILLAAAGGPGLGQTWVARANSTFDPDFTFTGHQPMFRDDLAAQYNYYTVLGARIEILIQPTSSVTRVCSLRCDDQSAAIANPIELMEQHPFKTTRLSNRDLPLKLTAWYDAAKWNKTTRAGILADSDQKIGVGSNPGVPVNKFFVLQMYPDNAGFTLDQVTLTVKITYDVMWRQPVDHIAS